MADGLSNGAAGAGVGAARRGAGAMAKFFSKGPVQAFTAGVPVAAAVMAAGLTGAPAPTLAADFAPRAVVEQMTASVLDDKKGLGGIDFKALDNVDLSALSTGRFTRNDGLSDVAAGLGAATDRIQQGAADLERLDRLGRAARDPSRDAGFAYGGLAAFSARHGLDSKDLTDIAGGRFGRRDGVLALPGVDMSAVERLSQQSPKDIYARLDGLANLSASEESRNESALLRLALRKGAENPSILIAGAAEKMALRASTIGTPSGNRLAGAMATLAVAGIDRNAHGLDAIHALTAPTKSARAGESR